MLNPNFIVLHVRLGPKISLLSESLTSDLSVVVRLKLGNVGHTVPGLRSRVLLLVIFLVLT